jgi:hypothetical protein
VQRYVEREEKAVAKALEAADAPAALKSHPLPRTVVDDYIITVIWQPHVQPLAAQAEDDGNTIILGGMLKMNQTKGGSKIPLLGDLPLLGGLFRSINNSDTQSHLYIFVQAEIIRPAQVLANVKGDVERLSDRAALSSRRRNSRAAKTGPALLPNSSILRRSSNPGEVTA